MDWVLLYNFPVGDRPIAYASKNILILVKTHHLNIEREALAIIFAIYHFHQYLYGRDSLGSQTTNLWL